LFSHEEETAQESFLFMRGEKLEAKLKSCGLTVVNNDKRCARRSRNFQSLGVLREGRYLQENWRTFRVCCNYKLVLRNTEDGTPIYRDGKSRIFHVCFFWSS
jgi:hypothetical protein